MWLHRASRSRFSWVGREFRHISSSPVAKKPTSYSYLVSYGLQLFFAVVAAIVLATNHQ